MKKIICVMFLAACALAAQFLRPSPDPVHAQEPKWDAIATAYKSEVQPLLAKYCQRCHSGLHPEADIDLKHFATLDEVRKAPRVWQKLLEMLDSAQMPPKDAKQLSDAERLKLQAWVRGYLKLEARARPAIRAASRCGASVMPSTPTRCAI